MFTTMRKHCTVALLLISAIIATPDDVHSQGSDVYGTGAKVNLSDDGSKFIRFITWHQVWGRFTDFNPGTTVAGKPQDSYFDMGIRRSRILVQAQLTDRAMIVAHIGFNNQTFLNGGAPNEPTGAAKKPQLFMHDAWVEYSPIKTHLTFGAGLHYWMGLSRKTMASTLNFMSLDAPIFNWPTIEATDQFARMIGFFAKGMTGPLEYSFSVNTPFQTGAAPVVGVSGYNPQAITKQLTGYVAWHFADPESMVLPFKVGTYLGTKKVVNVGAGFSVRPDGMWSLGTSGDTLSHDFLAICGDVFADIPLNDDRAAITGYAAYYHYDFGPKNLRTLGIMNIGQGGTTANGRGNAYPMIGTGDHVYAEIGYLFGRSVFGPEVQIQPTANIQYSNFDALDDAAVIWEVGANAYFIGHHCKLTGAYRSRPIFESNSQTQKIQNTGSKPEVILQAMVYF